MSSYGLEEEVLNLYNKYSLLSHKLMYFCKYV